MYTLIHRKEVIEITRFNFLIADEVLKAFQDLAKEEGKTASALMKELIIERLNGDLRKRVSELERRVTELEQKKRK